MVVGIMINGRTRPHVVANGTMTGQRYIDEVLLPHVRLFRAAVGDKFVFMDDNATCHRTPLFRIVQTVSSMPKLCRWRWMVSPSIVSSRNFAKLIHTFTCMGSRPTTRVLLAPLHDEFRGSRSDYVRQVVLVTMQ
ncbi:hypothetical protein TNCV_2275721 [Trichonephila clavipes]|nr:hypothetical protein TNCV_2275721 [Trichonephila clavipes]